MSQTVHGKLYFNNIALNDLAEGVNPHFLCPVCRYAWQPKLDLGSVFPMEFDFNQKVSFAIPEHADPKRSERCSAVGNSIELFVAVHKDADETRLCVQRSDAEGSAGISSGWWINDANFL